MPIYFIIHTDQADKKLLPLYFFPIWPRKLHLNPIPPGRRQPLGMAYAYGINWRNVIMQTEDNRMEESFTLWYPIGKLAWLIPSLSIKSGKVYQIFVYI